MSRKVLNFSFALIYVFLTSKSFAQHENIEYKENIKRTQIYAGAEVATLNTSVSSLSGYGARLGASYGLSPHMNLGFFIGQSYGSGGGGLSSLYTNFSGTFTYALMGTYYVSQNQVYIDGQKVISQDKGFSNVWDIGVSVEQMLLNGETQIYPATGISVESGYSFSMFSNWWKASARYSLLTVQSESASALFLNLSALWSY